MSVKFDLLLRKLKDFNQKFYLNELIKGVLIFLVFTVSLFLVISVFEYIGYFNSFTRKILFFGYLGFIILLIYHFVLSPGIYLFKFSRKEEIEKAAFFLGKHFNSKINDKIINTLQLKNELEHSGRDYDLLLACIEQKSSDLIYIPFKDSIDFKSNFKFLISAVFVGLVFFIGWFFYPLVFKESSKRIISYNQEFVKPVPYDIVFANKLPIEATKNERLKIRIQVLGDVIPDKVYISLDGTNSEMLRVANNQFEFEFRAVVQPFTFHLLIDRFTFGPYDVLLANRAVIKNFIVSASYPVYTRMENELFNNIGDLKIPVGTNLKWTIYTDDTEDSFLLIKDDTLLFSKLSYNSFTYEQLVFHNSPYSIVVKNSELGFGDSLAYGLTVIPDMFPTIYMDHFQDSVLNSLIFYRGSISDDYGFTDLSFQYRKVNRSKNDHDEFQKIMIDFDKTIRRQDFYYSIDFNSYNLKAGEGIEYFFEVVDNDMINGPKFSRSPVYIFNVDSFDDYIAESLSLDAKIQDGLSSARQELNSVQEDIDRLRRSMMESDDFSWELREELNNLLDKQEKIQKDFEESKRELEEKIKNDSQFDRTDLEILKKQEELEKLFNEVLSDELKELYEKIAEELQKLNRENVFDLLNQMDFELSDFEKRLDRALELFKNLQVEKLLNDAKQLTNSINSQQDEFNSEINDAGIDDSSLNQQIEIENQFDFLKDLLKEINDKNSELSRPNDLIDTSEMQDEISKQIQQAKDNINKRDVNDTDKSQRNVMKGLENMSNSISEMLSSMQKKNVAEDIRTLREILDNLLKVSFGQEDLMERLKIVNTRDPHYVTLIQNQRNISQDLEMIEDSLINLAKRQIQIESIVTREIAEIRLNIIEAIDHLVERRKHNGVARQQFVMTHVNNLALLLNESLQNMQMQMQGEGEGDMQQSAGESMPDIRQMQEEMNQMLQQMREGQQPMPGETGEGMGRSEQLARMAAEQEAIRRRLRELTDEIKKDGNGSGDLEEVMKDMERTELEIISGSIGRQTQLRQQRILTRLLEHEKAMLEREQEEKRVGETAIFFELSNPNLFFEYTSDKNRAIDLIRNLPPGFKQHYKSLVELYLLNVQE
jgi:hypothetical protein